MTTAKKKPAIVPGETIDPMDVDAVMAALPAVKRRPLRWRGREWPLPDDVPAMAVHIAGTDPFEAVRLVLGNEILELDPPVRLSELGPLCDAIASTYSA